MPGNFGERIASLDAEVVIDLTCYRLESAEELVETLRGRIGHLLHCGTIWVHGPSIEVPTTEEEPRKPFGEYGIRKAAIEAYLLQRAESGSISCHDSPSGAPGRSWMGACQSEWEFQPGGIFDADAGRRDTASKSRLETVHHVHADDVAQAFMGAMEGRDVALGECFHVVSPAALTLRGYTERMAQGFGRLARMKFLPWEEWRKGFTENDAAATWDHISHSRTAASRRLETCSGISPAILQYKRSGNPWTG